ncbi:hypothetical protein B0T18DRAFT_93169 [Schizothecium vesticola]|uniref:Uncharacterized protein n=1 Tax=Schizothecium vesticola TaxID=314040 RepID=A0AA40KBF9_9PEZI|nr:hypothetical protein B0T18DRAFT_93169 [Schizothecium vesticola]
MRFLLPYPLNEVPRRLFGRASNAGSSISLPPSPLRLQQGQLYAQVASVSHLRHATTMTKSTTIRCPQTRERNEENGQRLFIPYGQPFTPLLGQVSGEPLPRRRSTCPVDGGGSRPRHARAAPTGRRSCTDRCTAEKRPPGQAKKQTWLYDCYGLRRHVLDGYDSILSSTGSANPPLLRRERSTHARTHTSPNCHLFPGRQGSRRVCRV